LKQRAQILLSLLPTWLPRFSPAKDLHNAIASLLKEITWGTSYRNAEIVIKWWRVSCNCDVVEKQLLTRLIAAACLSHAVKTQRGEDIKSSTELDKKLMVFQLEVEGNAKKGREEIQQLQSNWSGVVG
jgi:hypothetical protein